METSFHREGDYVMGIGSVASTNSMSNMQMTMARSTDSKSKNIQNEITGVQQEMQKLSSDEEISVNEKMSERKKLQKEISSLNVELKQHQEELRRSQRREMMMAQLQEDKEVAKEEKTGEEKPEDKMQSEETALEQAEEMNLPAQNLQPGETDETKEEDIAKQETRAIEDDADMDTDAEMGLSRREMYSIVSANTSVQQAGQQGDIIARIQGGIVIFKGEIHQDERRGIDTEKKQAELEKMEEKEQKAREFQASVLGEANSTIRSAAKDGGEGIKNNGQVQVQVQEKEKVQVDTNNNAVINAFQLSKEEQEAQQRFYISLGNVQ